MDAPGKDAGVCRSDYGTSAGPAGGNPGGPAGRPTPYSSQGDGAVHLHRSSGIAAALLSAGRTKLRLAACFCGTDVSPSSPALQLCDQAFLVEPTTHDRYIDQLLHVVREHGVNLLVPTVDLDLGLLARHKPQFEELGCRVLVSDPDVIDTCQDKRRTFGFLTKNGFGTPATMSVRQALAAERRGELTWPCFLKRWDGYCQPGQRRRARPR